MKSVFVSMQHIDYHNHGFKTMLCYAEKFGIIMNAIFISKIIFLLSSMTTKLRYLHFSIQSAPNSFICIFYYMICHVRIIRIYTAKLNCAFILRKTK